MTDTASIYATRLLEERREIQRRITRELTTSAPAMVVLALTAVSAYAAFATFGIDWARAAGASRWEAAVWPIAVTVTTAQALYCRVQFAPWRHES